MRIVELAVGLVLSVLCLSCGGSNEEVVILATSPRPSPVTIEEEDVPPFLGDHLHAAYGIYICDRWLEPLTDARAEELGIHTHGDGVIHIHPFSEEVTGTRATMSRFFDQVDLEVTDNEIDLPGTGDEYKEGTDTCDNEPAMVQLLRWDSPDDESPEVITDDIGETGLGVDRQVFALVFGSDETDVEQPPSVPTLDNLTDVPASERDSGDSDVATTSTTSE